MEGGVVEIWDMSRRLRSSRNDSAGVYAALTQAETRPNAERRCTSNAWLVTDDTRIRQVVKRLGSGAAVNHVKPIFIDELA